MKGTKKDFDTLKNRNPLYIRSQSLKFFMDFFVAPVYMFQVADQGLSPGIQTGKDEGGSGPEIGRLH